MAMKPLPVKRIRELAQIHADQVAANPNDRIVTRMSGTFATESDSKKNLEGSLVALYEAGAEVKSSREAESEWEVEIVWEHEPD